jgi:hypothetical protein
LKDNRTLGEYIEKRMKEENISRKDLDKSTIDFFHQQYKTRCCNGHSEWSERFKRNIWVSDTYNRVEKNEN